jgi:hypothetical protein
MVTTMGWWKVEGTNNLIGDGPLDRLGTAAREVAAMYQAAFNRHPTLEEWEALLLAMLGAEESEDRVVEDAIVRTVLLEP